MIHESIKINPGDTIFLRWDINQYNTETMNQLIEYLQEIFPQNTIVALPKDIDLSVIESDDQYDF